MSEMIERLAKILYDRYGDQKDLFYVAEWEDGVRAVLAEIREPTKEMICAGRMATTPSVDADDVWRAMHDEMLK